MEQIELKTYTKDKTIVLHASGISAVMKLLELLWQNKINIRIMEGVYSIQEKTITIKQFDSKYHELTYKFTNVPIQKDGNLDTSELHKQIYNNIVRGIK